MPYKIKQCQQCGVAFAPTTANQKFCAEHKNQHAPSGKAGTPGDRRYLSGEARKALFRPRNCDFCGVEFQPTGSGQKFCTEHRHGTWEIRNRARHLEASRRSQRHYRHRKEFGDPDIYEKCVARYGEQCAICGLRPESGMHLAIDHKHASGEIRGLLCARCNTGLGYFKDESDRLRAAAAYLDGCLL